MDEKDTRDMTINEAAEMSTAGGYDAKSADAPERPRETPRSEFRIDSDGNPHGGFATGTGFRLNWMDGPEDHYGATLEDVLEVCAQRLRFFQSGKFACDENARALTSIEGAIANLELRTAIRKERGVEGTYTV